MKIAPPPEESQELFVLVDLRELDGRCNGPFFALDDPDQVFFPLHDLFLQPLFPLGRLLADFLDGFQLFLQVPVCPVGHFLDPVDGGLEFFHRLVGLLSIFIK